MKNLITVFKQLLFLFLFLTIHSHATNACTGTTNHDFDSSATYSDSGTLTAQTRTLYYFEVPSAGIVTLTAPSSNNSNIRYRYDESACPSGNNGTQLSNNGIITFTAAGDFNLAVRNSHNNNSRGYSFTLTFEPDASSAPTVTPATLNVNEDASNGTTVGTVSTTDGTPTSFSILSGNGDGIFQIDNSGVITIADNTNLDYESTTSYTLSVRADNATGNGTAGDITINVNDVADTPPTVTPATFSVDEDASNGTTVDTVSTTGGTPTSFTILSGNTDGIFQIDNSGVITIYDNTNLDFETTTSYILSVRADNTQQGTPGTITININDIDESSSGGGSSFVSTCTTGTSQVYRDFCLRQKLTLPGNMVTIGNTIMVAPSTQSSNPCSTYTNGSYISNATNTNDNYYLCEYWDDASRPSTSATVDATHIPDPGNSEVVWAGLYWQALVSDASVLSGMDVKIKNGTDGFVSIGGTDKLDYLANSWSGYSYAAFKDVTSVLQSNGWMTGEFTVGDIPVSEGSGFGGLGTYGAWTLVIVYKNSSEKVRNFSIFDGWQQITSSNDAVIDVSGFYTPKQGDISSVASIFAAEGDKNLHGDDLIATSQGGTVATLSNDAVTGDTQAVWSAIYPDFTRTPNPSNNQGIDIQAFELGTNGYDILDHTDSEISFRFTSTQDVYWPSMIAFNTELYAPELCYDYAYKQNGVYFTEDNNGSFAPYIIGDGLDTSVPVTVELFIRNDEDSDTTATNVVFHITDINTSQATYIPNSAYVTQPGQIIETDATGSPLQDINIEDIGGSQYFSVDYDLDPVSGTIDMPIKAYLEYTLVLSDSSGNPVPLDFETHFNEDVPLCTEDNFAYLPRYNIFNVENSVLSSLNNPRYNLPTQTANRAGDFKIASYQQLDTANANAIHTRQGVTTIVGVELIDADKYHDIKASCVEPDSALTPRVWVLFENNATTTDFDETTINSAIAEDRISDRIQNTGNTPIADAEEYFGFAKENAAFRVSYQTFGDDILQRLSEGTCVGQQVAPCYIWTDKGFDEIIKLDVGNGEGICATDMANGTDTIPQWCGNNGTKGLDRIELAECMECLFGAGIQYICSRDNFAIRPESFRMTLKDQDQSDKTQQSDITTNNDTTLTHSASNELQVVAGYDYALDINATNHQNDNNTPGYFASFLLDGNGSNRSIRLNWETSADDSKCNDIEDQNQTATFFNGTASTTINSPQIGDYTLTLMDKLWTQVDHDDEAMEHHTTGIYAGYFESGTDCIENSSVVPIQNASTSSYAQDMSGCNITTEYNDPANDTYEYHLNADTSSAYTDIALRIHPYTFNQSGVIPAIGPYTRTNGQSFIYMDTPPILDTDNTNMSYNMNGTFFAAGYDNGRLSNFVTGCYSDDLNMDLNYTYNSPPPTQAPYLWYSIKDHNTTDSSVVYRPSSGTDDFERPAAPTANTIPLTITQGEGYFAKDMNGSITMDLGYNFNRTYNMPVNPRYIQFNDFNISYVTNPTGVKADLKSDHQIFENKVLDTNVTFVYGRAKPSQDFYDDVTTNSIFTPISIVAYCDQDPITCSAVYNITNLTFEETDEFDWYLSLGHITSENDGNITLRTNGPASSGNGSVTPTDPTVVNIENSGGVDTNVVVSASGTTRPQDVYIDFGTNTNRWTIHNKSLDAIPSPFYRVRFIGQSDWAGHGDTGHVVDSNISSKKNRRLSW